MKQILIATFCFLMMLSCSKTTKDDADTTDENTMVLKEGDKVSEVTKNKVDWNEVDVTSPIVKYEEVKSKDIEVRGAENYSVYSVDESILFDVDKAEIRKDGEEKLKEVITSVKQRHPQAEIAVKGYTDAVGSKDDNKELAEDRAEAVAEYIEKNSDITEDRISIIARGEKDPVATNETEEGRQENRRVEILVRG
jgi:outer membrane protein OmpA-like peptidoglycan-associated protein